MQTKTVFVLGAGSSDPYDLPWGGTLAKEVAEAVHQIGVRNADIASKRHSSTRTAIIRRDVAGPAIRIANRIRRSRTETIDAYIAAQPPEERGRITRGMIDVLWKREGEKATTAKPPAEGDWIAWLYHNRLRTRIEEFQQNNVVFVSFNYERLPRFILATMISNLYSSQILECWQSLNADFKEGAYSFPRFIHPYGAIQSNPRVCEDPSTLDNRYNRDDLVAACEGIRIMGDDEENDPINYSALWQWAERVFCLGLGYHDELMKRIGLTRQKITSLTKRGRRIGGTGYKLTRLQRQSVRTRLGEDFQLGPPEQDCLVFLQHELANDE